MPDDLQARVEYLLEQNRESELSADEELESARIHAGRPIHGPSQGKDKTQASETAAVTVSVQLVREIRRLSGGCCEYCLLGENDRSIGFQIDHIVPVKHGGEDRKDNLCLACAECNGYKGPNVAALDPQTDEATKLYHPAATGLVRSLCRLGGWANCWTNV